MRSSSSSSSRAPAIVPSSSSWLPVAYKQLLECFEAMERAVPLVRSRGLPLLYGILAHSVERATSRDCTPAILACILGVWPEAYSLEVVEVRNLSEKRARVQRGGHQTHDWLLGLPSAAMAPPRPASASSLAYLGVPPVQPSAPVPAPLVGVPAGEAPPPAAAAPTRPAAVPTGARLAEFARRLEALVRIGEECPSPPSALLPPLPEPRREASHAPQAAAAVQPRVQHAGPLAATATAAGGAEADDGAADAVGSNPAPFEAAASAVASAVTSGCAGLSTSLLAKVMAREAAKKRLEVEAPALDLAVLLRRLPGLADAIRSIYHEANKRILGEAKLFAKLLQNPRWLTNEEELAAQVRLLARLAPHWCTLVSANDLPAVKLDPNVRFTEVQKALKAIAAKGELPAEGAS
jgi:hypothetical protein